MICARSVKKNTAPITPLVFKSLTFWELWHGRGTFAAFAVKENFILSTVPAEFVFLPFGRIFLEPTQSLSNQYRWNIERWIQSSNEREEIVSISHSLSIDYSSFHWIIIIVIVIIIIYSFLQCPLDRWRGTSFASNDSLQKKNDNRI